MRRTCLTIFVAGALACSSGAPDTDSAAVADATPGTAAPPVPAAVDHVLFAVNDLQAGIDQFERLTGVRAQVGGKHPGRGTQNALVSLGDATYLEIVAPNPDDSAATEVIAEYSPYAMLTPYDWAVRSEDLDALDDSLKARDGRAGPIRPGARVRPDGARLEWRTLAMEQPVHQFVPFFIQWGAFVAHPATTSPRGCTLRELRFEDPEPDELRRTFAQLGIHAAVSPGAQATMRVRLDCPSGVVDFPSPQG